MLKNFSSTMVKSITPMSMRSLGIRPPVDLNGCSRVRSIMSMATRSLCFRPPVAINGFGRIGKVMLRKSFQEDNVNVSDYFYEWLKTDRKRSTFLKSYFGQFCIVHNMWYKF